MLTQQVTPQELEAYIQNPPEALAPVAGMMRNMKANHDRLTQELAVEELRMREQEARVAKLRSDRDTLQAQREVLTETWRQLIIKHKAIDARTRQKQGGGEEPPG